MKAVGKDAVTPLPLNQSTVNIAALGASEYILGFQAYSYTLHYSKSVNQNS
jgi:hypothetical protein